VSEIGPGRGGKKKGGRRKDFDRVKRKKREGEKRE